MTTRTYDMSRRERAADETRARIIKAAHDLLNKPDGARLSLIEVAAAAKVTRATIYNRVGSRRDLLRAIAQYHGVLINYQRVLDAIKLEDPIVGVIATIQESCRAWGVIPMALRSMVALAALDVEVREVVEGYESKRREGLAGLVQSLSSAGLLPAGMDESHALATLGLVTSFQAYDHMVLGLPHSEATDHLIQIATTALQIPHSTAER